ncbi:hypothetical protein GCM10020218_067250 [Dactylosporangium vinaceum]
MWTFAVDRQDLASTTIGDTAPPDPGDGEAVLRVDRVGVTANNVTYAVLGDAMRYWEFFPPAAVGLEPRWGLVPLWGFADVSASNHPDVPVGGRVYGYLPPAGHLLVRPGRVDAAGFRDESPHRAGLPSPYNAYRLTTGDAAYRRDREDLLVLFGRCTSPRSCSPTRSSTTAGTARSRSCCPRRRARPRMRRRSTCRARVRGWSG